MIQNNINAKSKSRGFTIVELLVVIVVIGILASITIVSYTGITAKANTASNKQNASSVIAAISTFYAENSAFPATNATSATVITNINTNNTGKLPASLTVTSTTVVVGTATNLSYRLKGTTGACVGYWDYGTASVQYMFAGDAVADNGTTCS